jgi:hypothetical protein
LPRGDRSRFSARVKELLHTLDVLIELHGEELRHPAPIEEEKSERFAGAPQVREQLMRARSRPRVLEQIGERLDPVHHHRRPRLHLERRPRAGDLDRARRPCRRSRRGPFRSFNWNRSCCPITVNDGSASRPIRVEDPRGDPARDRRRDGTCASTSAGQGGSFSGRSISYTMRRVHVRIRRRVRVRVRRLRPGGARDVRAPGRLDPLRELRRRVSSRRGAASRAAPSSPGARERRAADRA